MFLTNISLKRPVLCTVIIIAMVAVGFTSYLSLGMNDMPEFEIPYVVVTVTLPGASPDQVETKVTKKVEEEVGSISGLKHITSTVSEGFTVIAMEFDDSKSVDVCAQDVRTKIDGIRSSLPDDMQDPVIIKIDPSAMPMMSLAVSSAGLSSLELSDLVENTIVPALNTVNGVGSITTYGSLDREVQIKLDKDKLFAYGLTTDQVLGSIRSDNIDSPAGKVVDGSREMTLRTFSGITNVSDFNNILVTSRNGTEIKVGDVAEVVYGIAEASSTTYYDDEECIGIDIVKQSGANTVDVADALKLKIRQLEEQLPSGVHINVVTDNSTNITASVENVKSTLIEGCVLAVLIVFLFLRRAASTLISAISLPTSIITTFAALSFMNFTLNTMTLLALSLAVGLLIDDAIVVIENIERHLHMGKTPLQAAKEGTAEIGMAVMAITFTIVAVFVPMAFMSGQLGSFFKEFALTIAFSIVVSLFVSFTLVPLLISRFAEKGERPPRTPIGRFLIWFNRQFDRLAIFYKKILGVVLDHRKTTILAAVLILVYTLGIASQMSFSFQPTQDKGTISISATLDSGLTLDVAKQKAKEIEAIVSEFKDVQHIYTTVESDSVSLSVSMTDKQQREETLDEITQQMRKELQKIAGLDLAITGSSSGMSGKSFSMYVQGDNFEELLDYCQKAKQILASIPGAVDVGLDYKSGKAEAKLVVDRAAAADLGVSATDVANTISTMFNGETVGYYETGDNRYEVNVILQDDQRQNMDSLDGIYLTSNTGSLVSLSQVAKKEYTTSSSTINRYDKSRAIQIQANILGGTASDLQRQFEAKLATELEQPTGIRFVAAGDIASMQESMVGLIRAIILGVLFVFLILAAQFESYVDPLAIMFSLPLAMVGALLALQITGMGLSMVGMIGIIFLIGLVTKNAVLLVDFIKQKRAEGIIRRTAILEAGLVRLRPIMMTTLAMIFGMLPAALSTGTGSEMRQPMGIAIIGGLISSTILTLLVMPVVYTILDDIKVKFRKKEKHMVEIKEEQEQADPILPLP